MTSDEFANRERLQREQLRAQYGSLLDDITAILFRHDPAGINFGSNTDEYDPEAVTILARMNEASSAEDVQRIVREEFKRWFGSQIGIRGSRRLRAADEIWQIWCERLAH